MWIFVASTFAFENMANLALAVNLVTYLNALMHYDIADAATHVTNFMGTNHILSIVMACVADAYMGRFKPVVIAAFVECLVSQDFDGFAAYILVDHLYMHILQTF
ncbi:putative proton-dependent oligopeptide transporter family [Helianthus annuus]|nr:putative proton-dependent oligopeptide transporter family [Helianthus annuus]